MSCFSMKNRARHRCWAISGETRSGAVIRAVDERAPTQVCHGLLAQHKGESSARGESPGAAVTHPKRLVVLMS